MKIILFLDSLANGGSQRQLVNLAVGLHERNYDVVVISYAQADYYLPRVLKAGIAYECLNKKGRFDLRPFWRLYKAIRQYNADVVVSFLQTAGVYAEFAGLLCPKTSVVVSERMGIRGGGLSYTQYIAGMCHSLANEVTGNSHHYLKQLLAKAPWLKDKSTVIYNGVDDRFFALGRSRIAGSAGNMQSDGEPAQVNICVVATRVIECKGLLPLVNAIVLLSERSIYNLCISWIGATESHNTIVVEANNLIEQHKLEAYWRWMGEVEDMTTCYGNFDALVLPSLNEGVPNVLCEAMASGLPAVATDISDNAQIVEPGRSGFLCKPDNPESLADALQALLALPNHKRRQMGETAHQTAKLLFSMDQFIASWEQVLCKTIR